MRVHTATTPLPATTALGVRVCVCVFIKLHITAQSGLVILCHSMPLALILPRGDQCMCVCVYLIL